MGIRLPGYLNNFKSLDTLRFYKVKKPYLTTRLLGYHVYQKNSDTIKKFKQIIADYQATWLPIHQNIYKRAIWLLGYYIILKNIDTLEKFKHSKAGRLDTWLLGYL